MCQDFVGNLSKDFVRIRSGLCQDFVGEELLLGQVYVRIMSGLFQEYVWKMSGLCLGVCQEQVRLRRDCLDLSGGPVSGDLFGDHIK